MPGVIAFKRRWSTGSDDLVVPGFFLFILHLTLFIIISIILGISPEIDQWARIDINNLMQGPIVNETIVNKVSCASEIRNFCFGYLSLLAVAAVLEVMLIWFSMQGTILDPAPRKPVEYILYARIFLGVIELIYGVVVSVIIGKHWKQCVGLQDIYDIQLGIVIVNIIIFLIVVIVGYCVFDPNGGKYYKVKQAAYHASVSSTRMELMRDEYAVTSRKTWLSRLSNCFCCVSNNKTNIKQVALDEVSTLLDDFFRDYDFVMSDIIAGLTLLRHKQQCAHNDTTLSSENNIQEYMCGRPISPDTNFIDLTNPHNRKQFEDVAYYGAYALAAYGPLFYWIENTGSGLCGILQECLCGENPTCTVRCCRNSRKGRSRSPIMRGNTGCGWVLAAIRKSLLDHGIGNGVRVVYISMDSDVYKQPFFVSVDHNKKAIVVTVRGTLAEADALTDLVACPTDIPCEGNDGTWKAHKGMVEGARFIKKKLLFEDMALSLGFGDDLAQGTRDYSLVLVGHSLGAGIASILALLLRPQYPNLKCYAYSPPGGLLSYNAMLASQGAVQTVILGKDIIPRCGISQLEHLRDEIIDLFKHTNLPKYRIILGNLCGSLKHRHNLLRDEQISAKELRLSSQRAISSAPENMSSSVFVASHSEELYPPGKIYHLVYSSVETESSCRGKPKKMKKYYLIHGDNVSDFGEIIVSHQMISHHLPQEIVRCMKKVLECPQKDPVIRSYAQSATLPFVELPSQRNSKKDSVIRNNKELQAEQEQPMSTTVTIEFVGHLDSETQSCNTDDSAEPFLNRNSNHIIDESPDVFDYIIASSNSLSSSSCDIKAPLAKSDSFTLSVPAQSPGTNSNLSELEDEQDAVGPSQTHTDVNPKEVDQPDNRYHNSLSFTDPEASSTPVKDVEENVTIPLTASYETTGQNDISGLGNTEKGPLITNQ